MNLQEAFRPAVQKGSYTNQLAISKATSWWLVIPNIISQVSETVKIIRNRLLKNTEFMEIDFPRLVELHGNLMKMIEEDRAKANYVIDGEKGIVKDMLDLINKYFAETQIAAGIQKRTTRAMVGAPTGTIDSYYYKYGKDEAVKSWSFN
jgi:hypothetical protein